MSIVQSPTTFERIVCSHMHTLTQMTWSISPLPGDRHFKDIRAIYIIINSSRTCEHVCARTHVQYDTHRSVRVCVCLSSFNEAPQTGLIEPLVCRWTPHGSDAGQCVPPPRATRGQTLLIRWHKQMHCSQRDQTPKAQSEEQGSQMVLFTCGLVCARITVSCWTVWLLCMWVCVCVCVCVGEGEGERTRALWGQRGVQCVRGLRALGLWFLSLAAWRISSPVSQCWAHAGQGEPRQENLCWCQQWKHHHPSTTSHNICQTAVCPFFLSLHLFSSFPPNISILTDVRFLKS